MKLVYISEELIHKTILDATDSIDELLDIILKDSDYARSEIIQSKFLSAIQIAGFSPITNLDIEDRKYFIGDKKLSLWRLGSGEKMFLLASVIESVQREYYLMNLLNSFSMSSLKSFFEIFGDSSCVHCAFKNGDGRRDLFEVILHQVQMNTDSPASAGNVFLGGKHVKIFNR